MQYRQGSPGLPSQHRIDKPPVSSEPHAYSASKWCAHCFHCMQPYSHFGRSGSCHCQLQTPRQQALSNTINVPVVESREPTSASLAPSTSAAPRTVRTWSSAGLGSTTRSASSSRVTHDRHGPHTNRCFGEAFLPRIQISYTPLPAQVVTSLAG